MKNAKNRFREGWIMVNRGFEFAEIKTKIQKMSVFYAYSDQAIFELQYTEEGERVRKLLSENYGKPSSVVVSISREEQNMRRRGIPPLGETQEQYDERFRGLEEANRRQNCTQKVYKGTTVETYVDGVTVKFLPGEYSVLGREQFDEVVKGDTYLMKKENETVFNFRETRTKIHYMRSRLINQDQAEKWVAKDLKDFVWFKPSFPLLSLFLRSDKFLLPDPDYTHEGELVDVEFLNEMEVSIS